MRILALDLATTTGWCCGGSFGHQKFASLYRPEKLWLFQTWVGNLVNRERPDLVGYEIPVLRGGAADALLKGMAGVTEATAHGCGAAVAPACRPSALKKFWTGNGRAEKADMIAECKRRGFKPGTDDEADAIALWHWLNENAAVAA